MEFLKKLNISNESKIYITGIICSVIIMFLITGVVFLFLISDKLDIVMTQQAGITYTYFMQIMDRLLAIMTILVVLPLTIFQLLTKDKTQGDRGVSCIGIVVFLALITVFFCGEYRFMEKYKNGELSNSRMFCNNSAEIQVFNAILKTKGEKIPIMCRKD